MKRLTAIVLAGVCAVSAVAQQHVAPRSRVGLTVKPLVATAQVSGSSCATVIGIAWTWAYTPNLAACAANGTPAACYVGFTLTDLTAGAAVATPATLAPGTVAYNYEPSGGMFYGSHNFSLAANGYDSSGNAITSSSVAAASFTNNLTCLNGPTGLTPTAIN